MLRQTPENLDFITTIKFLASQRQYNDEIHKSTPSLEYYPQEIDSQFERISKYYNVELDSSATQQMYQKIIRNLAKSRNGLDPAKVFAIAYASGVKENVFANAALRFQNLGMGGWKQESNRLHCWKTIGPFQVLEPPVYPKPLIKRANIRKKKKPKCSNCRGEHKVPDCPNLFFD
jgi:hypothetical protein